MERTPIRTDGQTAQTREPLTKPQLWLLAGAILIGIALEIWLEQDFYITYSIFWLVTLAVFVAFNWKRVIANKTVIALIVPTLVLSGILMFDYMNYELLGFSSLAIPALLLTIACLAFRRRDLV